MNSPSRDYNSSLDMLFRQALQPYAEAEAPKEVWPRVLEHVQQPPALSRWQSVARKVRGYRVSVPAVLVGVPEVLPYESRLLALAGFLNNQRRFVSLMA